jgi:centrosomal protein CEP164
MAAGNPESVVLEEQIDPNYKPSDQEIEEYANWLGMDMEADKHLMWVALEGLKAPLPDDWKPCQSPDGEIYYFNFQNGESVWDHPCDEVRSWDEVPRDSSQ